MDKFLDKYAKHLLVLAVILNLSYGVWMLTRGNLVYIFNFGVALYAFYILAKVWKN